LILLYHVENAVTEKCQPECIYRESAVGVKPIIHGKAYPSRAGTRKLGSVISVNVGVHGMGTL